MQFLNFLISNHITSKEFDSTVLYNNQIIYYGGEGFQKEFVLYLYTGILLKQQAGKCESTF